MGIAAEYMGEKKKKASKICIISTKNEYEF
jgi:hypothetical protein